jgi:hypothetical protein
MTDADVIDYDGRLFTVPDAAGGQSPVAHYRQRADLVWGEFTGGHVRRGGLVGTCTPDGELTMTYCMVLRSGEVISGRSRSTPHRLEDGRIRLFEVWERYGPHAAHGTSYLEELPRSTSTVE